MIIIITVLALECYALLDNSGVFKGKYRAGFMAFYTNLSNIMVFLYFLIKLFKVSTGKIIDFIVMMGITVTFLIYHFMLAPIDYRNWKKGDTNSWNFFCLTNFSLHYICPLLTIVYWIFCTDKSTLVPLDGVYFLILPLMYVIYIHVRKQLHIPIVPNGGYYPYPFMDVKKYGIHKVHLNLAILCVLFGGLGILVALIGMWIG